MFSMKKNQIAWIIGIVCALLCQLLPVSAGFDPKLKSFLSVTVLAIFIFAFELLDQTAVALGLMFIYVIGKFAEASVVFAVFQQPVLWAVIGGLFLANTLNRIGLLKRIALNCVIWMRGSYKGLIYGLVIASVVISFLMNNGTIPMVIFAFGICKALDLKPSRESAAIMVAAAFPTNMIYMSMYSATYAMGAAILEGAGIESTVMNYISYLKMNWPMMLAILVFAILLPRIMKPESKREWNVDLFKKQLEELGTISKPEWFGLIDCLLILAFMLTGNIHHINIVWGLAAGPLLLFLPGINTGETVDISDAKWSVFIFAAASITIGNVASTLGFGNVLAQNVLPLISSMNGTTFIGFTVVFTTLANFLMTPISLVTTFGAPFAQLGVNMGINPQAVLMAVIMGSELIFLPYEGAMYYVIYAMGGMIKMKDWLKLAGIKCLIEFLIFMAILLPYWHAIGFLG